MTDTLSAAGSLRSPLLRGAIEVQLAARRVVWAARHCEEHTIMIDGFDAATVIEGWDELAAAIDALEAIVGRPMRERDI